MSGRRISAFHLVRALAVLTTITVAGCGHPAQRSVDDVLKQSGKTRNEVYPLAGKITIDGKVPKVGGFRQPRLIVLLFDRSKLDASPDSIPKTFCDPNGAFAFNTYDEGDGVAPGKYVLAILELKFDKHKGYFGKDGLKNLYNDPEQNLKTPELVIDHQAPGKKDYAIDLKMAGRDPGSPGAHSVLTMH